MDIEYRHDGKKFIVEVWLESDISFGGDKFQTFPEDVYVAINDWCKLVLGYHARTAYHVFEITEKRHLDWFLLRWS